MDFDSAIRAHSEWKMKLALYVRKPDKTLNARGIEQDDQCALGQWIYGEGAKYAAVPEFSQLKQEHTRFHKIAADVVKRADLGQQVQEEIALGGKSEYAKVSGGLVKLLMTLKSKLVPAR